VSYAGYPGSTGLKAIDWRLTDSLLEPAGLADVGGGKAWPLAAGFWCFDVTAAAPEVGPLPALNRGAITFGCLNNFCKINEGVLELWSQVLRRVEGSRLMLLAREGTHRERVVATLERRGVARERVEILSLRPRQEYLALYGGIDIGLDTLPYNGHTTSLDAMWMGVPVVTLVGERAVGRAGAAQLARVGLGELAATTREGFVALARVLAGDAERLAELRRGLRERVRGSVMADAARYTRSVEAAFRGMWETWCAGKLLPETTT
jgi:predicted O-linked N-acetylglucosamine transferase (SPINDLY family)